MKKLDRITAMTDTSQQSLADGSSHAEPLAHLCDRPGLEREGMDEGPELGLQPFADPAGHFDLRASHAGPGAAAWHRPRRGGSAGRGRARPLLSCRFRGLHGWQMPSGRGAQCPGCFGASFSMLPNTVQNNPRVKPDPIR